MSTQDWRSIMYRRLFIHYETLTKYLSRGKKISIEEARRDIKLAVDRGDLNLDFDSNNRMVLSVPTKGGMQ